jgi:hypothetical protein
MGASVSTNSTDMTNQIISNISTNINNSCEPSNATDQECTVNLGEGCDIGGDYNLTQKVAVSGDCVFQSITNQDSQAKMAQKAQQKAKAEISGLNFGNVAVANNSANLVNQSILDMTTTINSSCSSQLVGKQICNLNCDGASVAGDVNMTQDISSKLSCASKSQSAQSSSSDLSQSLKQSAISKVVGLNPAAILIALAILILVIFGAPAISIAFAGEKVLKLLFTLFPIIIIVIGVILIFVGIGINEAKKGKGAAVRIFTKSIINPEDVSCLPQASGPVSTKYQDPDDLINKFGLGSDGLNKYAGFEMNKKANGWETTFITSFNRSMIPCTASTKIDPTIPDSVINPDPCSKGDSCDTVGNICKSDANANDILVCTKNGDDTKWMLVSDVDKTMSTIPGPKRIIGYRQSNTTIIWVGVATLISGIIAGLLGSYYIMAKLKKSNSKLQSKSSFFGMKRKYY